MTLILKGGVAASVLAIMTAFASTANAQDFTIDFGGRYMLDYTVADISGPDSKIRDEEIRRLRGKVSGKVGSKWSYKVETTLDTDDGNNLILEDAYVQFKPGIGNWALIVGQDNTTVSMAEETSSLFSSVYERAAFTDAFGAMQKAALDGYADIALRVPFVHATKADIVTEGARHNTPFAETWSCYKGGDRHCGRCGTCVERR